MSWPGAVKTRLIETIKGTKTLRAEVAELRREFDAFKASLSRRLVGGSAHSTALDIDPPIVWLKVVQISLGAAAYGRRIYADIELEATRIKLDEDDTATYRVESEPWATGLFLGARVYAVHAYNFEAVVGQPHQAVYRIINGESQGFFALIDGAPDASGYYPWRQEWLSEDNLYTDETVLTVEDHGVAATFAKARARSRVAYDAGITEPRIVYPVNTRVWMWFDSDYGFVFEGFEDAFHSTCA